MNQRIYNLSKWCRLLEGEAMPFPSPRRQRNVVLEINCFEPVDLYVLQRREDVARNPERVLDDVAGRPGRRFLPDLDRGEGADVPVDVDADETAVFLAHVRPGRDTIDFAVDGPFRLTAVGGRIHVYSQDSQQIEMHVLEPEVFTRIANRRQRNPQFEMMMYQQRVNMERRFQELAEETNRRIIAAEAGAKHKYAQERIKLGLDGKPLPDRFAGRKAASEKSFGSDVREEGPDSGEGRDREEVAVERDVSPPAKQPRGKAKTPS